MKHLVAPSILTADFTQLAGEVEMLNNSRADWVHLDIMDGLFVPNISFGFDMIRAIRKLTPKPLDVHLMIVQPERYFKEFRDAGADILSFHYEASTHLQRSIQHVKELGMKAGVALNPHTPVSLLKDILHDLDMVLLMTVNPGYGGQKFIEHSFTKIRQLRKMINETGSSAMIEVDGGVDFMNASKLVAEGVDILVAGNTVFGAADPILSVEKLKNLTT